MEAHLIVGIHGRICRSSGDLPAVLHSTKSHLWFICQLQTDPFGCSVSLLTRQSLNTSVLLSVWLLHVGRFITPNVFWRRSLSIVSLMQQCRCSICSKYVLCSFLFSSDASLRSFVRSIRIVVTTGASLHSLPILSIIRNIRHPRSDPSRSISV